MASSAKTNNNPVRMSLFRQVWWQAFNTPLSGFSLADGSANGKVKLTMEGYDDVTSSDHISKFGYRIKGRVYTLQSDANSNAKDDFWDLTGQTDLTSGDYVKVLLTVDESGNAQTHVSSVASSQNEAELPVPPDDECPFGWIEMEGANDWDGESLSTSGSYYEGYDVLR